MHLRFFALAALVGTSVLAACSGGGGSSAPAPGPTPTPGGLGGTPVLNQSVNFSVIVPPMTTLLGVRKRAQKRLAPKDVTNPYVSPQTASVVLQLGSVNGVSLVQAPPPNPPVDIPATCIGSAAGCTVPIPNVKAAKGTNRFQVETFSGSGGTGNIISTGYVDVQVPSATSAAFGGTALSIGGYTAQLSLVLIPSTGFTPLVPGTETLDVNAIDPGGAVIIGNSVLANPISLTFGGADTTNFTLAGAAQVTLTQSMQSVPVAYNGKVSPGGEVDASTVDENGNALATAVPLVFVTPTPTPTPTPVPTATPTPPGATPTPYNTPLSIYVYDASSDNIVEYDGVRNIEAGHPPRPTQTPRRAFAFAVDPNAYPNCAPVVGQSVSAPDLGGIAVLPDGTVYAQSKCTDVAVTHAYTFAYPTTVQQTSTPPPATVAFAAPLATAGSVAQPSGIKFDSHGKLFVAYPDAVGQADMLYGFSVGSPAITNTVAATCLTVLGKTPDCTHFYNGQNANFALDRFGYAYVPGSPFSDVPTGVPSQQYQAEPTIATVSAGSTNPAPVPFSALAGVPDDLGASYSPPTVGVEGTTLYALGAPGTIFDASGASTAMQFAGLSNCTVPPDPVSTGQAPACADSVAHTYLLGFTGATTLLTGAASGQNLVVPPTFEIGGDAATGGGFGTSIYGDILSVVDGFAYVANALPSANASTAAPFAAEIDVYDVRSVTGAHVDRRPVARIQLPGSVFPTAITIGPTGPVIGGLQILSHARPHRNIGAFVRRRELQLRELQIRNRLRHR